MEFRTVINRTKHFVTGLWDGKRYTIAPLAKVALPEIIAEAVKRQNVVMGSEDPFTGEMDYLVGIEEHADPVTPMEQSAAITRMNRAPLGKNEEVVKGHNGLYSGKDVNPSLPIDAASYR